MSDKKSLTALETKKCPPHHWYIDNEGMGRCLKCPQKMCFIKPMSSKGKFGTMSELYREKSANGGRIAQSKKRKVRKERR